VILLKVNRVKYPVGTRAQRRRALLDVMRALDEILDAETTCLGNMSPGLCGTGGYGAGQSAANRVRAALDVLHGAYGIDASRLNPRDWRKDLPF